MPEILKSPARFACQVDTFMAAPFLFAFSQPYYRGPDA